MQSQFQSGADGPVYFYRRSALSRMSYEIIRNNSGEIMPVGNYAVLDAEEKPRVTEARLMNLMSLLNGKKNLLEAAKVAGKSLYFQIVPKSSHQARQQIIFRERGATGLTTENAILSLDEGI